MLLKGIYTDPLGNQLLVPIAVSASGQILTSPVSPNSGPGASTLQVLATSGLLHNIPLILQTNLQRAYNVVTGNNAPDTVPPEVSTAANNLGNTAWKLYLGHNTWYYTGASIVTTASWTVFSGVKGDFSATVPAGQIFTFK